MPMDPQMARALNVTADPRFRDCVAAAVHHAVTTVTGDDGVGHCDMYANAGTMLLRQVTGEPYQPQVGSLMFLADPRGKGWFQIDATDGGLARMEFHAWIGKAGALVARGQAPGEPDRYRVGELVDLGTRHLRAMVERMQGRKSARRIAGAFLVVLDPDADRIEWTRDDDPPAYLWTAEPPDDFRYEVSASETRAFYESGTYNPALIARLGRLAIPRFHDHWNGFIPLPAP